MDSKTIEMIFYEAIKTAFMISSPLLLIALIVGLIVSFVQAATQINEQTLSFIPKVISVVSILIILSPWMFGIMLNYVDQLFYNIPFFVNQ